MGLRELYYDGILMVPGRPKKDIKHGESPALVPYSAWREAPPTLQQYQDVWRKHPGKDRLVLCGNVQVIDLDTKNAGAFDIISEFEEYVKDINPQLFERLYIETSYSGGRHYIFRCEPAASTNLADWVDDEVELHRLVDFLASNKLCYVHPSDGYNILQGDKYGYPEITVDERNVLIRAAMSLDRVKESFAEKIPGDGDKPGSIYANTASSDEIVFMLEKHGYTKRAQRGRYVHFSRPGARTKGTDFTLDTSRRTGFGWSTSITDMPASKGLSYFHIFTFLECNGDFKAAAKDLASRGYGHQPEQTKRPIEQPQTAQNQSDGTSWQQYLVESKYDPEKPYIDKYTITFSVRDSKKPYLQPEQFGIADDGNQILIAGPEKSRKTGIAAAIVSACLSGKEICGFNSSLMGCNILWIDTEQPQKYFRRTMQLISKYTGLGETIPNLHAYALKASCKDNRSKRDAVLGLASEIPDLKIVVIDGTVDLLDDSNDNKESKALVNALMSLPGDPIVINVLHINKGDTNVRGHIGTIIGQKADCIIYATVPEGLDQFTEIACKRSRSLKFPATRLIAAHGNMLKIAGAPNPDYWPEQEPVEQQEDVPF